MDGENKFCSLNFFMLGKTFKILKKLILFLSSRKGSLFSLRFPPPLFLSAQYYFSSYLIISQIEKY